MTAFFGNSQLLQWRRKYTKNHETSRRSKRGNLSWCVCPLVFAAPGNRGQEINSDIATWCLASSPPEIKKDLERRRSYLQRTRHTLASECMLLQRLPS